MNELDRKTRFYQAIIVARMVADITIILGIFIVFYVIVSRALF